MNLSYERTLSRIAMMSGFPVTVNGKKQDEYETLVVGPSMYRKFICVAGCSACCLQGPLTLDFIPTEKSWIDLDPKIKGMFEEVTAVVNGVKHPVMSLQKPRGMCYFLTPRDGTSGMGCGIWQTGNPLECWAAARIQIQKRGAEAIMLKKGFPREWRWEVRAQCEYPSFEWEQSELDTDLSVLDRYQEYADYFGILTVIPIVKELLQESYEKKRAEPRGILFAARATQ